MPINHNRLLLVLLAAIADMKSQKLPLSRNPADDDYLHRETMARLIYNLLDDIADFRHQEAGSAHRLGKAPIFRHCASIYEDNHNLERVVFYSVFVPQPSRVMHLSIHM